MNVIIVGCGKVGFAIAVNLAGEADVNLTIIDTNAAALNRASESVDAMLIRGNGLSAAILGEAGVREADLLISVTDSDEKNMLCGVSAKRLGAKRTIARVRDMEYSLEQSSFWSHMGLDMVINPEQETAREISRLLRFPTADDIGIFAGGRVELVSFRVSDAPGFFVGKSVAQIFFKRKTGVLLATVERNGTVEIPNGSLVFEQHDVIRIIGRPSNIMDFCNLTGADTERVKDVVIIGGGKISFYLLHLLLRHSSGTGVKVVEIDKERCELLSEQFPRCLILNADGCEERFLSSETAQTEAIICLTDRDEENAVIALYALRFGVRKVILKINRINKSMVKNLGLGSIVSPKNITADQVTRYVSSLTATDGHGIRTVYRIYEDENDTVEAVELTLDQTSKCIGVPLKDLRLKKGMLIGCVVRGSHIIIPTGETTLTPGDNLIIISKGGTVRVADDLTL